MGLPNSLIEVCEAVNSGGMFFYSFSVDFKVKVLVKPDETDEAVPAEYGHDCDVAGTLQSLLEVLVGAGGLRRARAVARVTVKVGQKLVAELLQLDQQVVGCGTIGHDANPAAALVGEFRPLIQHVDALDFRAGYKEKLLVLIRRELLVAFIKEQGTDG